MPPGDNSVAAGTAFDFSCVVTFKIPPLPIEVLVNGELDDGSNSRIIPNGSPDGFARFLLQHYLFQNISTNDNLTSIQCRTVFSSSAGETIITSLTPTRLLVFGGLHCLECTIKVTHDIIPLYNMQLLIFSLRQTHFWWLKETTL